MHDHSETDKSKVKCDNRQLECHSVCMLCVCRTVCETRAGVIGLWCVLLLMEAIRYWPFMYSPVDMISFEVSLNVLYSYYHWNDSRWLTIHFQGPTIPHVVIHIEMHVTFSVHVHTM